MTFPSNRSTPSSFRPVSPTSAASPSSTLGNTGGLPSAAGTWKSKSTKFPDDGRPADQPARVVAQRLLDRNGLLLRYDVLLNPFVVLKKDIMEADGRLAHDGRALRDAFGLSEANVAHLSDAFLKNRRTMTFTVPPESMPGEPSGVLEADLAYTGPNGRSGVVATTWRPVYWGKTQVLSLQMVAAWPRTAA